MACLFCFYQYLLELAYVDKDTSNNRGGLVSLFFLQREGICNGPVSCAAKRSIAVKML